MLVEMCCLITFQIQKEKNNKFKNNSNKRFCIKYMNKHIFYRYVF